MDDSIYYKAVQESPLIFKIKETVPGIYDLWMTHTKPKYPDYPFKANAKMLVVDLKTAFAESLKWLCEEEKEDDRKIPGWSEGFILWCASSALSTQWSYRYVYAKTDEYKQLFLLRTLIEYLEIDLITMERLEKLYNYFIEQKTGIDKINDKNETVVYLDKFIKGKKNTTDSQFKKNLLQCLDNIALEKYHFTFNKIVENQYLPKIYNFISYDEVSLLIHQIG
jgi:hypothetical protein